MSKAEGRLYYEDLAKGQVYGSGSVHVTTAEIKRFASEYDPQPFHLDEEKAQDSLFKGLAASGWHTAALTMRLLVEGELKLANGAVGGGIDELRWMKPVRPGDTLRIETEIVGKRESQSRPAYGIVQARTTTFNQNNEPVQTHVSSIIVPKRSPAAALAK